MTEEDLKAMKLHERLPIQDAIMNVWVFRTVTGWIYEYYESGGGLICAVPVYETMPIKEQTLPRLP